MRRSFFFLFFVLLIGQTGFGQTRNDSSAAATLSRAYELLGSNPVEATKMFERVVQIDPSNIVARRQLGYLYVSQGKNEQGLEQFQASEKIHSSDTIQLQIAYALVSLHRQNEANEIFQKLEQSADPMIRDKAHEGWTSESQNSSRRWFRVYADPYYDTRWDDYFIHFDFQGGYDLTEDHKIAAYGVVALSTDTKSSSGIAPVIISDNSFLAGGGFRFLPLHGLSVIVQEGIVFNVVQSGSSKDPQNDFRAVAFYGNGLYAPFQVHPLIKFPMYPFVDIYSSFGYYSRYKNGIGDVIAKAGLRAVEVSHTAIDMYARGDLVFDTQQEFYNNLIEGGVGLNIVPDVDLGLNVMIEYHRGQYLNVSSRTEQQRAALYERNYDSFRFFVIFEKTF